MTKENPDFDLENIRERIEKIEAEHPDVVDLTRDSGLSAEKYTAWQILSALKGQT